MPNMEGKVCLNHTDTPATSRCLTCFKPLCNRCVVTLGGQDFCSQTCADKHAATNQHLIEFQAREKARKARERMKKIIFIILFLAIAAGAYWYWSKNRGAFEKTRDSIMDQGNKLQKEINKTINK